MRRVTITWEGKPAEADQLDFDPVSEKWNEYALEDRTRLRQRTVAAKIFRLVDRTTPDGDPIYVVQSTSVTVADVPPELRKNGS